MLGSLEQSAFKCSNANFTNHAKTEVPALIRATVLTSIATVKPGSLVHNVQQKFHARLTLVKI